MSICCSSSRAECWRRRAAIVTTATQRRDAGGGAQSAVLHPRKRQSKETTTLIVGATTVRTRHKSKKTTFFFSLCFLYIFFLGGRQAVCFRPAAVIVEDLHCRRLCTRSYENGLDDDEYPWCFTGRLWFRPALVRVPPTTTSIPPPGGTISVVSVFGWTVGGTVALEYDTSPVGPYREYVDMGAIVTSTATKKRGGSSLSFFLGQWGSRLYVSTTAAEKVCRDTWNVPAELADIRFVEDDDDAAALCVETPPPGGTTTSTRPMIVIRGWSKTRVLGSTDKKKKNVAARNNPPVMGLPVWWTPSIKALWAAAPPLLFLADEESNTAPDDHEQHKLPLHRLRLSAGALRLTFCGQPPSDLLGIPFGIGLLVDNVLIEISRRKGYL